MSSSAAPSGLARLRTTARSLAAGGAGPDPNRRTRNRPRRGDLLAVKLPAWRSKLLLFGLFCAFSALSLRVIYLQGGWSTGFLQRQGEARYARTLPEAPTRGTIFDRNGVVLASSVPARAIWANPDDFDANAKQKAQLARLLEMTPEDLRRRIANDDRSFVYLRRQLDPEVAQRIEALHISGVHSTKEFRRQYPEGPVTSHLLGFTNVGERGLEGVERQYEGMLGGQPGLRHLIEDRLGHTIEDDWLHEPVQGQDIALAIDDRIQYIAHAAVKQAAEANLAHAAAAVVLDARTGELLALANWPDFDPAHRAQFDLNQVRDRAVTDMFEPGSTLKPFSIATAIENGVVRPDTVIDTSPGHLTIGGRTITDAHPHAGLTVEQVVAKSSNVGTAKIALQMPAQTLWETLTAVGFGQVPQAGLSGAVSGRLRPASTWRPVEQATIAYGYGISVSLLQLAHAYLVFARDGDIVPVSVLRRSEPAASVQVLSPATAAMMRHMLELATSDEGTAPAARIQGYRVAGKTGTARKMQDKRYTDTYISSFVGFAPASNPRIVVAVMVDDPRAGRYYGGDVAAPVFGAIAAGTLRAMQVTPDAPAMQVAQAAVPGG
ncbi:transpeptidase involved in septal peptidoglycan synthesis (penicillin-binding protein 3) [Burkholderiales bacterium]|jgi:cell division protein FtsI (penicillin-binding protein 3)|nr:transpeptidase involved in septal peptidoglycan synthesis (penicillin-binding protein 3) [Burkholderiales bacterium]